MKKLTFILFSIIILTTFSCKKQKHKSMTVVRDCTGTYLRMGSTDYKVCNIESITHIKDGDPVTVTYKPAKNGCSGQYISCKTEHAFDSWIMIEKLK